MRNEVTKELDRIDKLTSGSGSLEAFAFANWSELDRGSVGGALEYGHRLSPAWSAFARGEINYLYGDDRPGLGYAALLGMRWRW